MDTVLDYGRYEDEIKHKPKINPRNAGQITPEKPQVITPWEVKLAELGGIQGDEDLIRGPWEMLETMA